MNGYKMIQVRLHLVDGNSHTAQFAEREAHGVNEGRVFGVERQDIFLNRNIASEHLLKRAVGQLFQENGVMVPHQGRCMRNRFWSVFSQDKGGACEHGHKEKILDVHPFMAVPIRAKP